MTTTYRLISSKGTREIEGTREEALAAARAMDEELQPAYGVSVEDEAGETIAEIGDHLAADREEDSSEPDPRGGNTGA